MILLGSLFDYVYSQLKFYAITYSIILFHTVVPGLRKAIISTLFLKLELRTVFQISASRKNAAASSGGVGLI